MNGSEQSSGISARLYGIGLGPGDPELLTLKAARLIKQAPVLIVPKKDKHSRSYALSIVGELIDPARQEILELVFPMKKDPGLLLPYWQDAVEQIMARLRAGRDCVFLTEGDSLFYGTFIYVLDLMRQRYPEAEIEVVPGITSMNASAARAVLPLVNGDERLAVLPATHECERLRSVIQDFDVVVLLKISSVFDSIIDLLEELDIVDKAIVVKKCSARDEEVIRDIRALRGRKLDYLSLAIVRK